MALIVYPTFRSRPVILPARIAGSKGVDPDVAASVRVSSAHLAFCADVLAPEPRVLVPFFHKTETDHRGDGGGRGAKGRTRVAGRREEGEGAPEAK